MAVQIDKETLIKHRFWIAVPLAFLFTLIGLLCVLSVRSETKAAWEKAEQTNKELRDLAGMGSALRNQMWIDAMKRLTDQAFIQKQKLWYEVYDRQNGVIRGPAPEQPAGSSDFGTAMPGDPGRDYVAGPVIRVTNPLITWPAILDRRWRLPTEPSRVSQRSFGEPLGVVIEEYRRHFDRQYDELLKIVDFLDEDAKTGSVRAAGSSKKHADNALVLLQPQKWTSKAILDYEAWIAQEDIAIKRELLRIIADANNIIARLRPEWREVTFPKPAKETESADEGDQFDGFTSVGDGSATEPESENAEENAPEPIDQRRFLNTTWQVGIIPFDPDKGKGYSTDLWEGWLIDVELVPEKGGLALHGAVANLSRRHKVPPRKLQIILSNDDPQRPTERAFTIDAGDLEPTAKNSRGYRDLPTKPLWDIDGLSSRTFKVDVSSFPKAKKIVRIQLALTGEDKNVRDHRRFASPNWVMDIRMVPGTSGAGTAVEGMVYNRSGKRRLPASFKVTFTDGRDEFTEIIKVPNKAGAMNAGTQRAFPKHDLKRAIANPPKRIVRVREVLTWETVPVKRIDKILIGKPAHVESDRTKVYKLQAYDFDKKDPTKTPKEPGATGGLDDTSAGAAMGGTGGAGEGSYSALAGGGGTGGSGSDETSPNHGIPLKRYFEVTDELRRIPVALVLVVDMDRINDVLTAFANSRLQFRTTMSPWSRIPNLPKPSFAQTGADSDRKRSGNTGSSGGTGPGLIGSGPGATGSGGEGTLEGLGGAQGIGGSGADSGKSSYDESTQVELQIYGLITIYEDPDAYRRIEQQRKNNPPPAAATAG